MDLLAELNYDDAQSNAPIMVVMHGYSPATGNFTQVRNNAQRLRDDGFFVLSVAMRARDGSDGVRDSGGLEVHDIYDAVEAVKADPQFAGLIDPTNVSITGYSGGGGNTMSALTKFPDYFRVGAAFFGMSDYGYDPVDGWYNNGAAHRTPQLDTDVGNPNTGGNPVLDRYLARASNLASKNNPTSEIHLFVNHDETICPPINSTSFRDNAVAAETFSGEFNNITVHIGGLGQYEDFNQNSINDANELQDWPHTTPNANAQDSGELWFRDRLVSGAIPQPHLNSSDDLFVAGYVVTQKFDCWVGDGQNAAANLSYLLSPTLKQFTLSIASSDLTQTASLSIDITDMAGRMVDVEVNNSVVDTVSGGGVYTYPALGHNETLELVDAGPDTNPPPTLTGFAGVVDSTTENTEVELSFADLAAQGDEADNDGTVEGFVIQGISSGSLKLGADAGSATPFLSGANDTVTHTVNAYWTPAADAFGAALAAFTVKARDNNGVLSDTAVPVTVEVVEVVKVYRISGTFQTVTEGVNDDEDLTALGALDWAYWHETTSPAAGGGVPTNQKAGAVLIGNVTNVGGSSLRGTSGNNTVHDVSFTDGTGPLSGTQNNAKGILNSDLSSDGVGTQVQITLPSAKPHTVYLWVAAQQTTGTLTASLPGSEDFTDSSLVAGSSLPDWNSGVYQLTVYPQLANQTLTLRYVGTNGTGTGSRYAVLAAAAVSETPNTFDTWVSNPVYNLDPADQEFADDPDGDGNPNGIENVFGTPPNEASGALLAVSGEHGVFRFSHPLSDSPAEDLTVTYRWSSDLDSFYDDGESNTAGTTTVTFTQYTPADDMVTVTATASGSGIPNTLFVTLSVSQSPSP